MKYCIGCIHLRYEPAEDGYHYSDLTWDSGSPAEMACQRSHWAQVLNSDFTQEDLQRAMEMAEKCPDFSERPLPVSEE